MNWPDAVNEGFPPSHEGEPPHLRRDIADELADHLACAMTRELRRTDDEAAARRAVMARFGDPKAIARRLWLDAMKEIIMKDRIVIVAMLAIIVVAMVGAAMTWHIVQQGRQINEAILAKLDSMHGSPPARAVSENWSKAVVRAVEATKSGQAVQSIRVTLSGKPFNESDKLDLNAETDGDGRASFGPVRPGQYEMTFYDPVYGLSAKRYGVALYPGEIHEEAMVCPSRELKTEIRFQLDALPDWLDPNSIIGCMFSGDDIVAEGTRWSIRNPLIRLNAAGEIIKEIGYDYYQPPMPAGRPPGAPFPSQVSYLRAPSTSSAAPTVEWIPAKYRLASLAVYRPVPSPDPQKPRDFCWVSAGRETKPELPPFELKQGQANVWTISLPKDWLDEVHKTLPVEVSFSVNGVPDWLEPSSILEVEIAPDTGKADGPPGPVAYGGYSARPSPAPKSSARSIHLVLSSGAIISEIGTHPYEVRDSEGKDVTRGTDLMWPDALETQTTETLTASRWKLRSLKLWRPIPSRDPKQPKALYWREVEKSDLRLDEPLPAFEAELRRPNTWKIELPQDWLEAIHQAATATQAAPLPAEASTGAGMPGMPAGGGAPIEKPPRRR